MNFVVAIGAADLFEEVRASVGPEYPYEIRTGGITAVGSGCDAELVNFPLACERYGADRTRHVAQVLSNDRSDGAPELIVVIPPLEVDKRGAPVTQGMDYRQWVAWALGSSLDALAVAIGSLKDVTVLIHLESAGMDARPLEVLEVVSELGART
ncbi:hypothetical protein ACFQBY_01640 [Promicromonospora citrea]|uniref:Uncharacterized protein n=1 Tax=Promicromonospora citrea TaxID=43677 RepID=A0A8H9GSN8_9MICO|nr:hypothetical protein [Promicromonospora citrea]NNH52922.1 hypothetical protein [Promicromonospora citrea]GGM45020.1 hypothetical protein GCM10010102_45470 [Promicromonospora citrea]